MNAIPLVGRFKIDDLPSDEAFCNELNEEEENDSGEEKEESQDHSEEEDSPEDNSEEEQEDWRLI